MSEPRTITPLSSQQKPPFSSDQHDNLTSPPTKKKIGRPLGSKSKPQLSNAEALKAIFIEVPDNFDVIKAIAQFAQRHNVSITVLSASGTLSSVTLNRIGSHASAFTFYGPFSLISLTGTYLNNAAFSSSSSLSSSFNLVPSFRVSFSTDLGQTITGVVTGKVVAANGVIVVANIVNNPEVHKDAN